MMGTSKNAHIENPMTIGPCAGFAASGATGGGQQPRHRPSERDIGEWFDMEHGHMCVTSDSSRLRPTCIPILSRLNRVGQLADCDHHDSASLPVMYWRVTDLPASAW